MQKLEIKIAKSAEIRRLVTINWRYSITEQQWTPYSDSPTLTRYFMRSVNTNKKMKISFRTRTTRYLTFKFHRMASAMKEDTRILRATQKWNETYTQTHKRSKTKTIDEDFLQSRQKFAWIKIRHHWHSDIKFPPSPKKKKKKKEI